MLDELVAKSGIQEHVLAADFKQVFSAHGTTEYAFAIEELPCLQAAHPGQDLKKVYETAIKAYCDARSAVLRVYPDVEDTLEELKDKGCLLIGYTESMAYYTHYRLRKLGLDRILDVIYSPEDHDLPNGMSPKQLRAYPPDHYKLRRTSHFHTPKGELKPNPQVLIQIIKQIGAIPEETVYVGDNLMKDVMMAQDANVVEVWAKYGCAQDRPEYELLRKVTHWSSESVNRERELTEDKVKPAFVLQTSIKELLHLFFFDRFVDRSVDQTKNVLELWKTTIDVQKHFNELEMTIRNFALTIVTAVAAGAAYSIKEKVTATVAGHDFNLAFFVLLGGVAIWTAFYLMDRFWYHRLLLGAVNQGLLIERRYLRSLPEIGLTEAIGRASPVSVFGWKLHSSMKLNLFYWFGALMLLVAAIGVQFAFGPQASNLPSAKSNPAVAGTMVGGEADSK